MNRRFNKPIRTYERKKFREVVILTPKINNSNDVNNKNNALLNKNSNEESSDSMYDDPFETTFDRLLKNTRKLPPPAPKTYNDTILVTSTDNDKSEISNHKSSLLEMCNFDTKLISNQKVMHRKPKMRIVKKTIIKKKTSILQNSGKFKVCKDESQKKYELRKTRNNKKILFKHLNVNCLSFNLNESKIPESKKSNQDKRKTSNKKYFVKKKRKNDSNMSRIKSFNNIEIKPCFVNLDRSIVTQWNNKLNVIENNLVKKNDKLDQYSIINTNIDNFKSNSENMTCCSIKKEQLRVDSYTKSFNIEKKYKGIFSSTPNGKPIRPFVHLIPLSPISIEHLKKNKDSIMLPNNTLINENNEVSLESKLITNDIYKSIEEKCVFEDKSKLSSNFSECNLNQSENVDKKKINLLFNYTTNEHYKQKKESLIKIDSEQNISKNQSKQDELTKLITQEYKISNIKMDEYYLKFSIDENNSCSLFDNNESIQNILHNFPEENNVIKTSSNLLYDNDNEINEKNIKLNNKIHSNFVKLNEKSVLNIDKEIIFNDKIWEELPTTLIPVTLDSSSDDVEFKLKTKEIEDKNNSILIEQTLSNENNISNKKYSSIDGNNTSSCHVVLKQLQDPFRITRRKKYSKWDLELIAIAKDCNNSIKVKEKSMNSRKEIKNRQISQKKSSTLENIIEESNNNKCIEIKKPIYLKPGKSWARSLSILNNIQTEFNLEKLSVGKGKRWRDSVQDILNMQTQGIIQSCIKKNDSDKELQVTNEVINKSEHELVNKKSRTCDSTNFGRVSRRISVRVIPIHKTVKSIEDASFLEVYGIVPVKSQRFTLLNNNPRKSSTCNFQHDDIDSQIIKEHVVLTAREVILQRCSQKDYISFSTYFSDLYLDYCRKIGEGVYGEVFLYEQENKKSVIKIIPIEGNDYVNGEPQKKFHEILSEIVIAMELHNLRFNARYNTDGFVEVKNIKCIKGKYPERLIELWNIYDEEKHSDNDCPSMFNDDQLYIVLELGHGGQDLEAFVFNTAEEAHILFLQAALALAVAEKAVEFEHRDLHWGNILISPTNETYIHFKIGQKNIELISKGVKVSIIDFTLSRIKYQGCSVFNDLASDPTLFSAQGEYQFEIYRLMRDKVKNNWQTFEPYTNILWLHYTLDKMITAVRYRKRNLKTHKNGITKLKELKNEILTYNSAFEFVTNCDKIVNLLRINPKSG